MLPDRIGTVFFLDPSRVWVVRGGHKEAGGMYA